MKILLTVLILAIAFPAQARVRKAAVYPTVADLEAGFHFGKGVQLPKDVETTTGIIFHSYYVSGKSMGNGFYGVVVRLIPTH